VNPYSAAAPECRESFVGLAQPRQRAGQVVERRGLLGNQGNQFPALGNGPGIVLFFEQRVNLPAQLGDFFVGSSCANPDERAANTPTSSRTVIGRMR